MAYKAKDRIIIFVLLCIIGFDCRRTNTHSIARFNTHAEGESERETNQINGLMSEPEPTKNTACAHLDSFTHIHAHFQRYMHVSV